MTAAPPMVAWWLASRSLTSSASRITLWQMIQYNDRHYEADDRRCPRMRGSTDPPGLRRKASSSRSEPAQTHHDVVPLSAGPFAVVPRMASPREANRRLAKTLTSNINPESWQPRGRNDSDNTDGRSRLRHLAPATMSHGHHDRSSLLGELRRSHSFRASQALRDIAGWRRCARVGFRPR